MLRKRSFGSGRDPVLDTMALLAIAIVVATICVIDCDAFTIFSAPNAPCTSCPALGKGVALRPSFIHVDHRTSVSRSVTFESTRLYLSTDSSGSSKSDINVQAQDFEALQKLFSKYCDKDGLMDQSQVKSVPYIAEILSEGDLLPKEFDDIWDKAAKFPDVEGSTERIDVDSFVQIYRDIDDLFEEDDNNDTPKVKEGEKAADKTQVNSKSAPETPATIDHDINNSLDNVDEEEDEDDSEDEASLDGELEKAFQSLRDANGLVSKEKLMSWDEVDTLIQDGLLGKDETERLWQDVPKSAISKDYIDAAGFAKFNVALDELFDFDDEDMAQDEDSPMAEVQEEITLGIVQGDDMTPDQLFEALSVDGLVDTVGLQRWGELRDMLDDGDIVPSELQEILDSITPSEEDESKFDKEGFMQFYNAIDEMFEEYDDDEDDKSNSSSGSTSTAGESNTATSTASIKEELIDLLEDLAEEEDRLACGLDSTEREQRAVLGLVDQMENSDSNIVRSKQGAIDPSDISGTWELLYSSSSAMKFNKGLSGLGGSIPNGRFAGVKQILKSDQFLTDAEYVERIEVNPSSASFDVRVTGDWELRSTMSLFTGEPSTILTITPDRVMYGPTSTRADHWKSLGPLNMLDVAYLDNDFRIMRGNTSTETVFIFRRTSS